MCQLPDDILVNFISRLTVNEAARTSVLSSRWKCLWTCSTTLNFEDPQKPLYVYNLRRASDEERCKYIGWVNRVLELRADSNINEFRIRFDLKDLHKSAINHWIYTAIDKGVKKLELNLKPYNEGVSYIDQYTFSEKFFNKLKTITHFLSSVNALRSLRLEAVNITKEILEFFIYNCPFLEQLLVAYSSTLSSLKVVGSSIQLKSLDIQCCHLLEEIEISAPSLVSFKYVGGEIKLHLTNVPQLVDVWIGGSAFCVARIRNLMYSIKSILPQLKTLDLQKYRSTMESIHDFLPCTLPKLRQLTIEIFVGSSDRSLIGLVSHTMNACPYLHKLTLKFLLVHFSRRKDIYRYEKRPHQHLKVVELVGFCGFPVELELAINLLENATLLERMIVELPSAATWSERIRECAGESTKMLTDYIPPGVDLVTR
ncbi:F-box protein At4g09920-like [Pistacia vera]|uniref:F-box protein At4g09920-like n=1 Tax=Pistacia vera TaxID=55513 RepID=UPI00126359FD|nr:F-box protein At4g09920-like [Pistacia vera]